MDLEALICRAGSLETSEPRVRGERKIIFNFTSFHASVNHIIHRASEQGGRLLQRSIQETIETARPHVYVCSSFKEEFGISVHEAMAGGFVVMAPFRGGVGSCIQNGLTAMTVRAHDPAFSRSHYIFNTCGGRCSLLTCADRARARLRLFRRSGRSNRFLPSMSPENR
jgi:hypothetical protein